MFVIRNRQEYLDTGKTYDAAWGYTKLNKEPEEGWTCLGEVFQFKTQQLAHDYAVKNGIELGFWENDHFTNLVSIVPIEAVVPMVLPKYEAPNQEELDAVIKILNPSE